MAAAVSACCLASKDLNSTLNSGGGSSSTSFEWLGRMYLRLLLLPGNVLHITASCM